MATSIQTLIECVRKRWSSSGNEEAIKVANCMAMAAAEKVVVPIKGQREETPSDSPIFDSITTYVSPHCLSRQNKYFCGEESQKIFTFSLNHFCFWQNSQCLKIIMQKCLIGIFIPKLAGEIVTLVTIALIAIVYCKKRPF